MKNITLLFVLLIVSLRLLSQGTFTISAGASVKLSGNAYIVLDSSHFINNGSLQMAAGDGTIQFTGAIDNNLSGSGTTTIDHLALAKAAASTLFLQTNIAVGTEVKFSGGLLNVGSNVLDLGTTAVLNNESEGSRAFTEGTGYIKATGNLNAPASANIGNLGAIITSSANMGATTIKRGNEVQVVAAGSNSIRRYYDITPANNTSLNATLRFQYFDGELNGLDESALTLWKSADDVTWTQVGNNSRSATANYVEKNGLNDFSRWTLAQEALTTYYQDFDKDGYGNPAVTTQASAPPAGYVTNNTDCDDNNIAVNPATIWYLDADNDGYSTGPGITSCTSPGIGYKYAGLLGSGDCLDNNPSVHPGAVEICGNGIDDNCDGFVDENCGVCANATNLTTSNITSTSAQLNWVASVNPVQWQVQYKTTNTGAKWVDVAGISTSARSVTIGNLKSKQAYNWHIRAKCNKTWTAYSGAVSFKTTAAASTLNAITEMQPNTEQTAGLQVQALPNPSSTYFTLQIRSNDDKAVLLQVFDGVGRMVEGKAGIASNSTLRIGYNYRPGIYYAQVLQGSKMVTVKLMKHIY